MCHFICEDNVPCALPLRLLPTCVTGPQQKQRCQKSADEGPGTVGLQKITPFKQERPDQVIGERQGKENFTKPDFDAKRKINARC